MSRIEVRLTRLEQHMPGPKELNWLCIAPIDETLIDNIQVFKRLEDVPESYNRDYPNIKVYTGVCPNDWNT